MLWVTFIDQLGQGRKVAPRLSLQRTVALVLGRLHQERQLKELTFRVPSLSVCWTSPAQSGRLKETVLAVQEVRPCRVFKPRMLVLHNVYDPSWPGTPRVVRHITDLPPFVIEPLESMLGGIGTAWAKTLPR